MDITLAGSSVTYQPDDDQLTGLSIELAAFDGEVGNGVLPIADQSAALTVATGRQARIDEGTTLISDGFMLDQDRTRGPVPAAGARLYGFGLADANALLDGFRVQRSRPAETDYARVIAFAAADLPTVDTSMVLNASTVTMPAKRYDSDGGWTSELISDLVEFTGKTLFLHDKADGSGRCLHYHVLTSGHTCGLTISDAIPEDGVTNFYPWAPTRKRTSVDLRNDVKGRDQAGRTSTATDSGSITAHDVDGLQHQSLIDFDAASQGDLDLKTAAFLASSKDDLDTWQCAIGPLDEDALALIRPGDLVTVTSSVMGLTAAAKRIAHMTLTVVTGENGRARPGWWMAALELGAPVRRRARVKTITPTTPLPPWVCIPTDFAVYADAGGDSMGCIISTHGDGACSSSPATADKFHLYAGATYSISYIVYHAPNGYYLAASLHNGITAAAEMPMGKSADGGCDFLPPNAIVNATTTYSPGWDQYVSTMLSTYTCAGGDTYSSSIITRIHYLSGSDPRFVDLPACSNAGPQPGQSVPDPAFTGDGTTTAYTAAFPYIAGSLTILVNGLVWTPYLTETDPTTGAYTLAYEPPLGSTVRVEYRAS